MRAEAMFASEQLVKGLTRLATVPNPGRDFMPFPASNAFPALYSSLLPLSNAVERLCKLGVIALAVNSGEQPPSMKKLGHRITDLVKELATRAERYDWQGADWEDTAARQLNDVVSEPWAGAYLDLLDRYAAIDGRYEMIDGLVRADEASMSDPPIFGLWTALPYAPLTDRQEHLCAVRELASDLLDSDQIPVDGDTGHDAMELLRLTFTEHRIHVEQTSLARALRFQRLGCAITSVLKEASTLGFYRSTSQRLVFPEMSDVLEPGARLNPDSFVGLVVLGFADDGMALEAAESLWPLLHDYDEDE